MFDILFKSPNILFSFFGRYFLIFVIFCISSFSKVSIIAQESDSPPEAASAAESAPQPVAEPAKPLGPEAPTSEPSETPPIITTGTIVPSETPPNTPPSSLTMLETGDGVIPLLEGVPTPEMEEAMTLFSSRDFLIEIEIIFSDLDTDIHNEIQNDPTLADNTDEDPDVDLIDPSIISDPPRLIPDPIRELPPEDSAFVPVSQEVTESIVDLLQSLFEQEDLSIRHYEKEIVFDKTALHKCRADIFRTELSTETLSHTRLTLSQNNKKVFPSFLEVASLPEGIDVVFRKNDNYFYAPGARETIVDLDITHQPGAIKGDFSISIIYTLQIAAQESSVACQINIVNN